MSHRDRILNYLGQSPDCDDDKLAAALSIKARQTVNQVCRRLASEGLIDRTRGAAGKIINSLGPAYSSKVARPVATEIVWAGAQVTSEWYWEGNIVSALAAHLRGRGWDIISQACTHSRERGYDIEAKRGPRALIVEVKGYPSENYRDPRKAGQIKRANPSAQATHWFAHALLTAMRIRNARPDADVAIAFPRQPRYAKLLQETAGSLCAIGVSALIVSESGSIAVLGGVEL